MSDQAGLRTAVVVETNYLIASVIEEPLANAGYRVLTATDPAEALKFLDQQSINLAVIDFRLQHAQPDGLVAALTRCGIPFIFCTAASTEEVLEHFPGARVMLKPFSDEDLLKATSGLVSEVDTAPRSGG
jgi:CheY-like chemotaxis protein